LRTRQLKSWLYVIGICLGSVGIVVCAVLMIVLWIVSIRVGGATEKLFGKVDASMGVVHKRVVQTKDRVTTATITANDLETTLRNWTRREVGQRLAPHLDAAQKTEQLASSLRQADDWLEVSESAVGVVQEILSISASTSAPTDTTFVDELKEQIQSVRVQVAEATAFVGRIQERIAETSEAKLPEARIEQAIQLGLRVVATLGSIGPCLEKHADRITAAQSQLQDVKARTQRWRLCLTMGLSFLMIWMAAGQAALCRLAWNGWRTTSHPIAARSDESR
jgi:hypothetical protein